MESTYSQDSDPFADQGSEPTDQAFPTDLTIELGRNASLTLGTDSLIVLDESLRKWDRSNCCGLWANGSTPTRAIPFFNVLWAELGDFDVTVHYAQPTSKTVVRVDLISYPVEKPDRAKVAAWTSKLMDRAYGQSQRSKRIKVLINPYSGRGGAGKWFSNHIQPVFAAARCEMDIEDTKYCGHAVEIAEKLDVDAYDVVASCSGDGLPHEVFNGLGKRKDAKRALGKVALVQLPCGTGNAMSWNLNGTESPSMAALSIVKGLRTPLDLVSITQGERRSLSFLSQSVGIVAEVDLGTENIRWMGSARFNFGFLVRLLGKTVYPCDIAVKVEIADKSSIRTHYQQELGNHAPAEERRGDPSASLVQGLDGDEGGLPGLRYGSVTDPLPEGWELVPYDKLGNFYAGNMAYMTADANFFPAALPNDGFLDLVCVDGDISRLAALQSLMAVEKGTFFDIDHVSYRKISGYRIIPKAKREGYISIDGEKVPFEPFQAEVHRGLGTVLSKSGHIYEAQGVDHK